MAGEHHQQHIEKALLQAEAICTQRQQRFTPLRRQVLSLIWQKQQPVGAYQILEQLKVDKKRAAPPTVYRAIDFLLAQGLIHRIASLNAFIGCVQPEHAHLP